jgi:Protein of unknown function (DUF3833)
MNRRQCLSRSVQALTLTRFAPLAAAAPRCLPLLASASASFALSGCAQQELATYAKDTPKLDLRDYFNGQIKAWGIFTDRSGQVVKRFVVDMRCSWRRNVADNTDEGVLDERFMYADGAQQQRIWRLTRHADGRYNGRADDVVGEATGQEAGNAFYWAYTLALPVGGSVYHVQFEDWMYLIDDQVMLNKARMSKWGVHLGDVSLSFTKQK